MLIKEILTEMPAIAGKHAQSKPVVNPGGQLGDTLYNVIEPGQIYATIYPYPDPTQIPDGKYTSPKELENTIKTVEQKFGKINWVNTVQRKSAPQQFMAFALSKWRNENNQIIIIGKFLHNTKSVGKIHGNNAGNYNSPTKFDANDLADELGYHSGHANSRHAVAPGATSADAQSQKKLTLLEPKDLLAVDVDYTSEQIIADLTKKLGTDSALVNLAQQAKNGQSVLTANISGISVNNLDKYFAEILHPMALIAGGYSGDHPKFNFKGAKIKFTQASGALSDSILTLNNGEEVFVSSKKDAGTPPAIGADFKELLDNVPDDIRKSCKQEYAILNLIATSSAAAKPNDIGPLSAAIKLKLLTQDEAEFIANTLARTPSAQDTELPLDTPTRLKEIVQNSKSSVHGKQSYFILMYYFMVQLAQKLNADPKVAQLIKSALGQNFITMSTSAKLKGEIDTLQFTAKLLTPERNVVITTGTAYHSNHIKNRLQFVIQ